MNVIIKDSSTDHGQKLYRYFDGVAWVEKWEKSEVAFRMVMTNHVEELEPLRKQVLAKQLSPLAYHIQANLFDIKLLSSYTGISRRNIKKSLKQECFNQLDEETLNKYATAFGISVAELKKV
jgi:hypothetical protein